MELKKLISHFTYRIEPKPGGGFIAHPADPTVAPIEAPTREELQKKIQENILGGLNAQFPSLKLSPESQDVQLAFHIERRPGGGFAIHSSDPNAEPIEVLTHNDMESHFAEKMIGFMGKRLTPELAQALATQGKSGDIKVVVKRNVGITVNTGSQTFNLPSRNPTVPNAISNTGAGIEAGAKAIDGASGGPGGAISNSPIMPEANRSGRGLRLLVLLLLAAGVLAYLFLNFPHSR